MLWSLFEYNERDRLDAQVSSITAAMSKYAPGKPWALMAGGYTLEGSITPSQQAAQAAWLARSYQLTHGAGSVGYAWFNLYWPGSGGAAGELRLELNEQALSTLRSLP